MEQPKRILVVDNKEYNRNLLEAVLDSLGYESELAQDGLQASAMLDPSKEVLRNASDSCHRR